MILIHNISYYAKYIIIYTKVVQYTHVVGSGSGIGRLRETADPENFGGL